MNWLLVTSVVDVNTEYLVVTVVHPKLAWIAIFVSADINTGRLGDLSYTTVSVNGCDMDVVLAVVLEVAPVGICGEEDGVRTVRSKIIWLSRCRVLSLTGIKLYNKGVSDYFFGTSIDTQVTSRFSESVYPAGILMHNEGKPISRSRILAINSVS